MKVTQHLPPEEQNSYVTFYRLATYAGRICGPCTNTCEVLLTSSVIGIGIGFLIKGKVGPIEIDTYTSPAWVMAALILLFGIFHLVVLQEDHKKIKEMNERKESLTFLTTKLYVEVKIQAINTTNSENSDTTVTTIVLGTISLINVLFSMSFWTVFSYILPLAIVQFGVKATNLTYV